jgi:acyl-CoA reductase-like NAD-dependent aldehyde dehydrogenase
MLRIPVLRKGKPYTSVDEAELKDSRTGEVVALLSQANSGLIARDLLDSEPRDSPLGSIPARDLVRRTKEAAEHFLRSELPLGSSTQGPEDYIRQLSSTTGLPLALARQNMLKIHKVMSEVDAVLRGLTRDLDLSVLDGGYGLQGGQILSFYPEARWLGAVLPSNSPGVHALWIPAIPLKTCLCLKPGREEPWSPYRIIQAFVKAGVPAEAFSFYPTDHGGAGEILRRTGRSLLFGDAATTRAWARDPRVQVHGPGYSKVIFGDDAAPRWEDHLDLLVTSILENGGRSCINASGVWTPAFGREIAAALAERLARVRPLPPEDPEAGIAGFASEKLAEAINSSIDQALLTPGAEDLTARARGEGSPRLVKAHGATYILPTIIWCEDPEHPLANREFLFPFASVVQVPQAEILARIGPTLVATALTRDPAFQKGILDCRDIDRLNLGGIPTCTLSWDQPHEGNLFQHLYRQRALQHVA